MLLPSLLLLLSRYGDLSCNPRSVFLSLSLLLLSLSNRALMGEFELAELLGLLLPLFCLPPSRLLLG